MSKRYKDDLEEVMKHSDAIGALCEKLQIQTTAGRSYVTVALANALLMDRKQRDYGPKNISGFGTFGVIVRMNDKFERLKTLFTKKRRPAVDESIEDTIRDVANYAIIAQLIETNTWPTS